MDILNDIHTLHKEEYPYLLHQLSSLPEQMDIVGIMPPETYKYLCVVGPRKYSEYGKAMCEQLIAGLAGYPIVIVSGLALGMDGIAHESAIKAGLKTIAFPGSGLPIDVLYPAEHLGLARRIVEAGGALLSPFKRNQIGAYWTFPVRNKLMAGISQATLIIEAKEKSGTLLTANDTLEFSRDLLVVPGSIFSDTSKGSNDLLRDKGTAVINSEDILAMLGLQGVDKDEHVNQKLFDDALSADEKKILEKVGVPINVDDLLRDLPFPVGYGNALLIELELKGSIKKIDGLVIKT